MIADAWGTIVDGYFTVDTGPVLLTAAYVGVVRAHTVAIDTRIG
jgi:hypothetical protein